MPDGQRGEVISVVQRRRRWTTEQKLALVEEVMRPGRRWRASRTATA